MRIIEETFQNFLGCHLGQFSYFTIKKNKTRGFHFHNTKIEKFLILKGKVKFEFKIYQTIK